MLKLGSKTHSGNELSHATSSKSHHETLGQLPQLIMPHIQKRKHSKNMLDFQKDSSKFTKNLNQATNKHRHVEQENNDDKSKS